MKLTKSRLKRIIKEELDALDRSVNVAGEKHAKPWSAGEHEYEAVSSGDDALDAMQYELSDLVNAEGTFDNTGFTKAAAKLLLKYAGKGQSEDVAWKAVKNILDGGGYDKASGAPV